MNNKSFISGVGYYLPPKIVTNHDLAKMVDTSDEWIVKRTGIKQRHIVENESCADLATKACIKALKNSGLSADDIDGIVVATTSSDNAFPATATVVAGRLGINKGCAFDVSAACAGFVFGLNNADNMIRLGQAKNILVVGVDLMSKMLDWKDRNTCILFGDGAGAVVLSQTNEKQGILSTHIFSDGNYSADLITVSSPNSPDETGRGVNMDGKTVYKFAVKAMSDAINVALDNNNMSVTDVDWVIPHQANLRIIDSVAENLNVEKEKVIVSVDNHANISAATIPVAMGQAEEQNKFTNNDLIALTAMGAGFSWGSCLLRWK